MNKLRNNKKIKTTIEEKYEEDHLFASRKLKTVVTPEKEEVKKTSKSKRKDQKIEED